MSEQDDIHRKLEHLANAALEQSEAIRQLERQSRESTSEILAAIRILAKAHAAQIEEISVLAANAALLEKRVAGLEKLRATNGSGH